MKRRLYGQKKAPAVWIEWEAEVLKSDGVIRDLAALHLYFNPDTMLPWRFMRTTSMDAAMGRHSSQGQIDKKDRLQTLHEKGATYEHLRRARVRTANGM